MRKSSRRRRLIIVVGVLAVMVGASIWSIREGLFGIGNEKDSGFELTERPITIQDAKQSKVYKTLSHGNGIKALVGPDSTDFNLSSNLPLRKKTFELFLDSGVMYPFFDNWCEFHAKFPDLALPYLELRPKTLNEEGEQVDLTTLAYIRFIWISDEVTYEQYSRKERETGIRNKPGSYPWLWASKSRAEPRWEETQAIVLNEKGGQMNERRDLPYGAKAFRVPILPSDYQKWYPKLAEAFEALGIAHFHFLRCGEWYRTRVFMKYDDIPSEYKVSRHPRQEGEFFSAYFQVPAADEVKPGEIASMDLLVLPRMRKRLGSDLLFDF